MRLFVVGLYCSSMMLILALRDDISIFIYVGLVAVVAAFSPVGGGYGVLMSLPMHGFSPGSLPTTCPSLVVLAATTVGVFRSCFSKNDRFCENWWWLGIPLLVLTGVNTVLQGYPHKLPHLLLFAIVVFYAGHLRYLVGRGHLSIATALSVMGIAVILSGGFEAINGNTVSSAYRLAVGENIRGLANPAGFAAAGTACFLLLQSPFANLLNPRQGRSSTARMAVLAAGTLVMLTATVSRGAILAYGATLVAIVCGAVFVNNKYRRNLSAKVAAGFTLIVCGGLIAASGELGNRVSARMGRAESGADVRQDTWKSGISQMTISQCIFGGGVDTFPELTEKVGIDLYAHSVFIDTFASFGLVGSMTLAWLLIGSVWTAYRSGNVGSMGLVCYIIVSHLSHGAINSVTFIVFVGLALGTVEWCRIPSKDRRRNKYVRRNVVSRTGNVQSANQPCLA